MRSRYKRRAWYLDDHILLEGYTDKRGFHPNSGEEVFARWMNEDINQMKLSDFMDMNQEG
jgi:hypothetical protein